MGTKFYNKIIKARQEREVEDVYVNALQESFDNIFIEHPYGTDGYFTHQVMYDKNIKVLRLLMEFKHVKDFNVSKDRAIVLVQVLYYLKMFQDGKDKEFTELPNIILAGDKNKCFILHVNRVSKYLTYKIDWSIAPSEAPNKNKELVKEIEFDKNIRVRIFEINQNFKFKDVVVDIKRVLLDYNSKLKITENNIAVIFDYFINKVIREPHKYTAQDLVYYFINVIINDKDTFLQPKREDSLYVKNERDIKIDKWSYDYFISNYSTSYTHIEEEEFTKVKDRLIEDTTRRYNGEFYTPTIWADESHKEIEKIIGEDWKEKFIVWDCAWGTGNLTRDYNFSNLYCSTINDKDLQLGENYNCNSTKFKFDFLNDLINTDDVSIPLQIEEDIKKNKALIFFINPPFAEASNGKSKNKKDKSSISKTNMKKIMTKDGLKDVSQQLYAQFLYRILKIKKLL